MTGVRVRPAAAVAAVKSEMTPNKSEQREEIDT